MSSSCCSGNGETLVFTCAGAAYAGQLANHAGIDLMKAGKAKLFCIAALAAELPEKLDRARSAWKRIAIDGCDDHCCRKIMEKVGMPVDIHVVVTDLGIEKQPAEPHMLVHTKRVVAEVETLLDSGGMPSAGSTCCCG